MCWILWNWASVNPWLMTPISLLMSPSVENGRDPTTIQYSTIPRLQTSTSRPPKLLILSKSSGAAYSGEPQWVAAILSPDQNRPIPKSTMTSLWWFSFSTMFSNLRSLWTIDILWRYETASTNWQNKWRAFSSLILPWSTTKSNRLPPDKNSRERQNSAEVEKTS